MPRCTLLAVRPVLVLTERQAGGEVCWVVRLDAPTAQVSLHISTSRHARTPVDGPHKRLWPIHGEP